MRIEYFPLCLTRLLFGCTQCLIDTMVFVVWSICCSSSRSRVGSAGSRPAGADARSYPGLGPQLGQMQGPTQGWVHGWGRCKVLPRVGSTGVPLSRSRSGQAWVPANSVHSRPRLCLLHTQSCCFQCWTPERRARKFGVGRRGRHRWVHRMLGG